MKYVLDQLGAAHQNIYSKLTKFAKGAAHRYIFKTPKPQKDYLYIKPK